MGGISRIFSALVIGTLLSFMTNAIVLAQSSDDSVYVGDTILHVNGKTSPNAFVTISNSSGPIGTTTATVSGDFSHTITALSPGIHTLRLYARDTSNRISDVVSETVSLASGTLTTLEAFLPSTITISSQDLTLRQSLVLSGQSYPSATLNIRIDNTRLFTAQTNGEGIWKIDIPAASLGVGNHELFALTVDSIGNQSHATSTYAFTIVSDSPTDTALTNKQTNRPPLLAIPGRRLAVSAPKIDFPKQSDTVSGTTIPVFGTALKNSMVEIWDGDSLIGSVWTDGNGKWMFELQTDNLAYDLRVRACQRNICSDYSETVSFTVVRDALPLQGLVVELEKYHFGVSQGQQIRVNVTALRGQPLYSYQVIWGDNGVDSGTTAKSVFDLTHVYTKPGRYSASIIITDSSGAKTYKMFTIAVDDKINDRWYWHNWWLITILSLITAFGYRQWRESSKPAKKVYKK